MPQPLEEVDDCAARLRKERVVEAGDEEGDWHGGNLSGPWPLAPECYSAPAAGNDDQRQIARFQPIKAATVALVANTAPVAFGAIAIPVITLAKVTELPDDLDRLAPQPRTRARGAVLVTSLVVALALIAAVFAAKHAVEIPNGTRIPG
ncbi:MAG TPA: L-lactate permease [Gaiellaceae bacterium]|nr:L-lactate permease [Gaiellaceae bacterium]